MQVDDYGYCLRFDGKPQETVSPSLLQLDTRTKHLTNTKLVHYLHK